MKLVFVIPSMGFGGAERVVSVLANMFVNRHQVCIIMTSGGVTSAYPLDERIRLVGMNDDCGNFKRWISLRKACKDFGAEAVVAFMDTTSIMTALALSFTKIPVIASERNDPSAKDRRLPLLLRILKWLSQFKMAGYVFQSKGAREYYSKRAQRKSCIILNPLDTDNLPIREPERITKEIVTVGRLHAQKNQQMLIDAFAASKFSETHTLHIFGEGELRNVLEDQICRLGLNSKVFLEGNCPNVLHRIKNAELFVFTSNYEGMPNALMEAMAIGIPCISTDCSPGGARMLIDQNGENGILIPCADTKALVENMNMLHEDRGKMKEIGEKAAMLKTRVSCREIAEQWLKFVQKCVRN